MILALVYQVPDLPIMLSKNLFIKSIIRLIVPGFLLLISGCTSDENSDMNRPGYDSATRPQNPAYNNAPGYYYHQPGYAPQPVPAPAPYYQQQQQYQQVPPGSRYYSNPYDIPPAGNGYNYYDADQYYVPPTRYNNNEGPQYIHHPRNGTGGAF